MRRALVFLSLCAFAACGNVASDGGAGGAAGRLEATGGTSAGGRDGVQLDATGGASSAGAGGAGGAGGRLEAPSSDGGRGGAAAPGGAGGIAPTCVSNNESGFAFGGTCDGGGPASKGCHASCQLSGAHYVGCVAPSTAGALAAYCYASCADCL